MAAKAAATAAAKERYFKAYADPAGKHVAAQLPADTGARSAASPSEATAASVAPDAVRLRSGVWGGFGAAGDQRGGGERAVLLKSFRKTLGEREVPRLHVRLNVNLKVAVRCHTRL